PGLPQARRAPRADERVVLQIARGDVEELRRAVRQIFDRRYPAGAAGGHRTGRGGRQSDRAYLLALAVVMESVRYLPAGVELRRIVSNARRHLRRSTELLHQGS